MSAEEALEGLHRASIDGVTVEQVVTSTDEFSNAGISITRTEIQNNQLEVMVGEMADGTVVEFDVKFSIDGSLMSVEMYCGDPRSSCGIVEAVVVDE